MPKRIVVIGGDAAGMSAASTALRRGGDDVEVVAVERGWWTSYSQCGIPYWIAGAVGSADSLVVRSPAEHRERGIDVRPGTEAIALDLDAGTVAVRDVASGDESKVGYDHLVLATGARPLRPDLPGIEAGNVFGIQTLDDGRRVLEDLEAQPSPRRAVVVGAGYIGIEVAEALLARGLDVTVVNRTPHPMGSLDHDMGQHITDAMRRHGIDVRCDVDATGFEVDDAGRARAVVVEGESIPCDLVTLGIGVTPDTSLAESAGIGVGSFGGLQPDDTMRIRDGIWAAGDCVEAHDRVLDRWTYVPLGTHANKQGGVVGVNATGGVARFPGIVRTAITRFVDLEIARAGATDGECTGILDAASVTVDSTTMAGYMPDTEPMTVKMTYERRSGRLLGAQIVGGRGAAMRINVIAMALWSGLTVDELAMTDLAYAPPFSSVWDPVQIAARAAAAARR